MIQPFTFQHCTAFRERKQIADKVNEIIDYLNNGSEPEIIPKIEDWEIVPIQEQPNLYDTETGLTSDILIMIKSNEGREIKEPVYLPKGLVFEYIKLSFNEYKNSQTFSSYVTLFIDQITTTDETVNLDYLFFNLNTGMTTVDFMYLDKTNDSGNEYDKLLIYKRRA